MKDANAEYTACKLCNRNCGVDRIRGEIGYCRMGSQPAIARAMLHMWEEPIISGTRGSGTIFFVGCSLGCVYCQNSEISRGNGGVKICEGELAELMLGLKKDGAHNINFVTPTHYVPSIISSVSIARERGLDLPIVYNTGGYDNVKTVEMLCGTVDVYLPDFKYYTEKSARSLSLAPDYPTVARDAIAQMVKQKPIPIIKDGIMKSGVIVRILLLPGHLAEAKLTVKYLHEAYGNSIYISLMSQYTPMPGMESPLNRRVTNREYNDLVDYAAQLGVEQAFVQKRESADTRFIPPFVT